MSTALTTAKTLYPVSEYLSRLQENMEARTTLADMPILSLPLLNNKLWGFQKRKFYIIAARPSIGKSAFALQLAYDLAMQNKRVLFLSLEMTVEDMLERLFCYEYKIDNQELQRGNFKAHTLEFDAFCQKMINSKLVFSDCIGRDWEEIEQILNHMTVKPEIIFIDHLNAIKSSGFNPKAEIDMYILNLCTMAKKNNLAVVLCCQINRDNQKDDDKTPQLHELKGSGNLEEMADVVIMLHWPFKYKKDTDLKTRKSHYVVLIGKNRNGPTGFINLTFKPEHYTYKDATQSPADEDTQEEKPKRKKVEQQLEQPFFKE